MRKPPVLLILLVLSVAVVSATSVNAYVLFDFRWPSATTTFNVDIPGADGLWNTAFEQAMGRWNAATIFDFRIRRDTLEDLCDTGNSENGAGFVSDVCGEAFGENTLATTKLWGRGDLLTQSDILFNNARSWNVYDGPYRTGSWTGVVDFRRVAVHELGHALGLNHEDDVPAIMVTSISRGDTIVAPQADDIAGVDALYGTGTSRAPRTPVLISPSNHARDVSSTPTLSWRRATNADSYDVYFGTSSNPSFVRNTTGTSYRPSRLAPNTTHYWSIQAKNSDGTARSATYRFTTVTPAPQNDRFSMATRISGRSGRARGSNVGATMESGESGLGDKSVWWQWRSPSNGTATIDTVGSSFDTILGVYTGTRVGALTRLAESDNAAGIGQQSRVILEVEAATVYWLRVSGRVSPFGRGGTGNIVLNWNLEAAGVSAEHKYIFPQFVFGGGWASTLTLTALNEDETTCNFSAQGRHMTLRAVSGHSISGTEIPLGGFKTGQWNIFKTEAPDEGPVSSGMAILQCDRAVLTHVLFSLTVGGSVVAEALVEPSHEFKAFEEYVLFFADHRNGARFGVAVANPSDRAIDVSVQVSDDQGEVIVDTTVNVDANTSKAFFLDELGTIPEGHTGGVALRADESLYVIGLRFTGQVFTTIPAW